MAYKLDYGTADPWISDILKQLTVNATLNRRLPTIDEVVAVSGGLTVYWWLVHKQLGDNLASRFVK